MVTIALEKLFAHPLNSNAMRERELAMLRRHIERTGRYEPLVVRRHPVKAEAYEILNGHQRWRALKALGHAAAECVVWEVDDQEAMVLLATLNRLEGREQPRHRAELLERLAGAFGREALAAMLPETGVQLEKRLAVRHRCVPVTPKEAADRPRVMTFFVNERQQRIIEGALKDARKGVGGDDPDGRMTRGDLLAVVLENQKLKCKKQNDK